MSFRLLILVKVTMAQASKSLQNDPITLNRILKQKKSLCDLRSLHRPKLKDHLNRTYTLVRSVQYEQFLKELGVEDEVRKAAANMQVTVMLKKENGTYSLMTTYPNLPTRILKFRIGEKIERQIPGGREVSTIFEVYENKLIEKQNLDGKEVVIKRKFTSEKLLVTMEINGIRCHRYYNSLDSKHSIGTETSRRKSVVRNEVDLPVVSTPPIESVIEIIEVSQSETEDLCL